MHELVNYNDRTLYVSDYFCSVVFKKT